MSMQSRELQELLGQQLTGLLLTSVAGILPLKASAKLPAGFSRPLLL